VPEIGPRGVIDHVVLTHSRSDQLAQDRRAAKDAGARGSHPAKPTRRQSTAPGGIIAPEKREEAAMLSRVALILCAIISVAACQKKSEPTDAKPSTPADAGPAAITTAEGPVKAGGNYGAFRATSPTALKLAKGTTLTATPEGPVVAFKINNGTGGSLRCQCDSGCTGACTWETSPTDATCSGTCEGPTCGACSWHYERPRPDEGVTE
jgi:hypothetical protein